MRDLPRSAAVWASIRAPAAAFAATALVVAGCGRQPPNDRAAAGDAAPTFTADVAPILFEHCAGCHRAGQPTPFPLVSYADVQPRARAIAAAVEARRMPPWLPDPGEPAIVGERHLSDAHIATIGRWFDAGAAEGDRAHQPAEPRWSAEWMLGEPDVIAAMPRPYVLSSVGHDVYRNVVLRVPLATTRFVRALEFRPGEAPVHHAVIRIDRAQASRGLDGADGQPGFDGMAAIEVQDPDGHFLGGRPAAARSSRPRTCRGRSTRGATSSSSCT
jgi:hypothetical protein